MKILITGADGFIGSHLTEILVNNGYGVRALCQYNSMGSWGWLDGIVISDYPNLEILLGDVRDSEFCINLLDGIDVVINLAALIAIPYSYQAARSYIETNVLGTLNLCQAAHRVAVQKFIQISTSEVYGTAQYVPIDELHPLQPQSPYSASKISSDAMAMSYYHSFNLPVVIARPFNTFGPRQSARAVIPNIISQLASGIDRVKLGDVTPTRDFNYVDDTCSALVSIMNATNVAGEVINIGSGVEISIEDLFYKIADLMQIKATIDQEAIRMRPVGSEVKRLLCDSSKLKKLTGFESKNKLDVGLQKTINWFSDAGYIKKYKTELYNV